MKFLSVSQLEDGMVVAQDVFPAGEGTMPFLRKGALLSVHTIARLREQGIHRIYVEDTVATAPEEAAAAAPAKPVAAAPAQNTAPKAAPPAAEPPKKAAPPTFRNQIAPDPPPIGLELKDDALASLERLFGHAVSPRTNPEGAVRVAEHLENVATQLVETLVRNQKALVDINHLKSVDDDTYHHSLAVAVLSIAVGQQMGLSQDDLSKLALAAIMHDIGKTSIPLKVMQKPSHLNDEEYALVQTHASAGTAYLMGAGIGDETVWQVVLLHHERIDGRGYPTGIAGARIPLFSRIISVADVYDAMTSERPYRNAMLPSAVMEYIMGGSGTAFDHDVVTALVRKVDMYPVGSCLELSNGRLALVLDNEYPSRPVVELLDSGEVVDLLRDRKYLSTIISRKLPDAEAAPMKAH